LLKYVGRCEDDRIIIKTSRFARVQLSRRHTSCRDRRRANNHPIIECKMKRDRLPVIGLSPAQMSMPQASSAPICLRRIPIRENRLIEKNTRQRNKWRHVLIRKVDPLFGDML
jgi:hypothetical protein